MRLKNQNKCRKNMEQNKNHQCKFCDFDIHVKALLTKHIVFEHWNEIAELTEENKRQSPHPKS